MDRWCASRYGVSWHKTVFAKTPLTLLNCRHVKSSQKNKEDVFFVFVIGARLPTFTGERSFQLHFAVFPILMFRFRHAQATTTEGTEE